MTSGKAEPADIRFWSKVRQAGECWEWTAARVDGYGRFSPAPGITIRAHRWSYEALRGEIPDGLQLDHLCRNRACVNPWHLDPVTLRVNVQRGSASEVAGVRNREKTNCPYGHPYEGDNLVVRQYNGWTYRSCRDCRRARDRRRRNRSRTA